MRNSFIQKGSRKRGNSFISKWFQKIKILWYDYWVKAAGGVLYLDARKADGVGPLTGNDSPWVDLTTEGNDGTLTNFAGTGTSGWQASPNLLRFDGVDDFVAFADTASLDITTAPLAIGVTVIQPISATEFVLSKNANSAGDTQYSILLASSNQARMYINGTAYANFIRSSGYINLVFYWDGSDIYGYENGVPKNSDPFIGPLISNGTVKLGTGIQGGSLDFLLDGDIATATIYTGSDIDKILKAEAKISAEYLALNP